jgi:hypothetical protein
MYCFDIVLLEGFQVGFGVGLFTELDNIDTNLGCTTTLEFPRQHLCHHQRVSYQLVHAAHLDF